MFQNQVEKEKEKKVDKERVGERKREGGSGIKWKVEKKKERMEKYGYTCGVKKKQKNKKKGNVWMKEMKNNIKNKK